jgi:hypothetical protein
MLPRARSLAWPLQLDIMTVAKEILCLLVSGSLALLSLDKCEECTERKFCAYIYFTAFCRNLHFQFLFSPCKMWYMVRFLAVVLVTAIAISSVATISRSIASVV